LRIIRHSHSLLVTLYLCITGLTAQDTTGTWLNTLEEEANGATATFYRTVWEEEGLWKFREYYRSGDLHKTGQYTASTFIQQSIYSPLEIENSPVAQQLSRSVLQHHSRSYRTHYPSRYTHWVK
jgi:hypothetical protein